MNLELNSMDRYPGSPQPLCGALPDILDLSFSHSLGISVSSITQDLRVFCEVSHRGQGGDIALSGLTLASQRRST